MGTKKKRILSMLIAFILIAAIILQPGMSVTAAVQSENGESDVKVTDAGLNQEEDLPEEVQEEVSGDEYVEEAETIVFMAEEESAIKEATAVEGELVVEEDPAMEASLHGNPDGNVNTQIIEESEAAKSTDKTEESVLINRNNDENNLVVPEIIEELDNGSEGFGKETEEMENDAQENEGKDTFDSPTLQSLIPLKEVKAYLALNHCDEEEIRSMPVTKMLGMLRDRDGNKIEIAPEATLVWVNFKMDEDNIDRYDQYTIGSDETVDLSESSNVVGYRFEMIVGNGNQLNGNNVRYIVKVFTGYPEDFEFELFSQGITSIRTEIEPKRVQFVLSDSNIQGTSGNAIPGWNYCCFISEDITNPYLGVTSKLEEHPDVSLKFFETSDFLDNGWNATEITNQILNQDMTQKNAGYRMTDTVASFLVFYYIDGVQQDALVLTYLITGGASEIKGELLSDKNGEKVNVTKSVNLSFSIENDSSETYEYVLEKNYSASEEYYLTLDAISGTQGNINDKVEKAVVGFFDSVDAASGAPDIKEELLSEEGYKANYGGDGVKFTLFFSDYGIWGGLENNKFQFTVKAIEDDNIVKDYNDAPIIGAKDPWFRVIGAKTENDNPLDVYVVENGKSINLDTMYGYGYQTIFINDIDVDLSKLRPIYWYADAKRIEARVTSDAGTKLVSGETVTDFSNGAVQYTVIIDNHQKNYQVDFVKKTEGANLYVAGPRTQEVFLDEYFEYKHDILIANTGDQPLTGLRVELDATNAKLDDYWTVGGNENDTLAAFTETSSDTEYGELANIAKIRLLPDGDGDIEGTLKIYADGQEPIVINLTGRAQNPRIITETLDDAVKYVPYSYWISTNNMYDWTSVEYTLTGELPEGVDWYPQTGELYGVPQESGTFPIHIDASFVSDTYTFESSGVDLTLTVKDNTNDNVYYASDEGYTILDSVGTDVTGAHDYVMTEIADEVFRSSGELGDFIDLWLNGEKLIKDVDYFAESGSTKITIRSQTFNNKANQNGSNTLAAEFRVGGDTGNDLKRTAQNFRLNLSGDTPTPTPQPTTTPGAGNGSKPEPTTTPGAGNGSTSQPTTTPGTNNGSASNPATVPGSNATSPAKPSDNSSNASGNGSGAGANTPSEQEKNYVNINVNIIDADDEPMTGTSVEIHSTPQSAVTNDNGTVKFTNVEFGAHTITVKDADGNIIASKNFEIVSGSSLNLNGDKITAQKGSDFVLKIKVDGKELTFVNVELLSPRTGDNSNMVLWFFIANVSLFILLIIVLYKKRRNNI